MSTEHSHRHYHVVANPSGEMAHEIHHTHSHSTEYNEHHHYIEEPGYKEGDFPFSLRREVKR